MRWRRAAPALLGLLVVSVLVTSCASLPRPVWYPGGVRERPRWLDEPTPGCLLGMGTSATSEQEARDIAMRDVARQMAEAVATRVSISTRSERSGDALQVNEVFRQESEAFLSAHWSSVTRQALRYEVMPGRGLRRGMWSCYVRVPFGADERERLEGEIRARFDARVRQRSAHLDALESAAQRGSFRDALAEIAWLDARSLRDEERGLAPDTPVPLLLERLLAGLDVRVVGTTLRSCAYDVRARVALADGTAVTGVPLVASVAGGNATLDPGAAVTDGAGEVVFSAAPADGALVNLQVELASEAILGLVSARADGRQELMDRLRASEPFHRAAVTVDPARDLGDLSFDASGSGYWAITRTTGLLWMTTPPRLAMTGIAIKLGLRATGALDRHVAVHVEQIVCGDASASLPNGGWLLYEGDLPAGMRLSQPLTPAVIASQVSALLSSLGGVRPATVDMLLVATADGACPWRQERVERWVHLPTPEY
jgi:hypothetical protein